LQITFTLAGTSAGAGDTLDVTGTDWRGAAQNESIDVSAGDGAYTGSKYWRTITDIDCTGWADGTLAVTQPEWGVVHEKVADRQYYIDCAQIDFGDDSTATYFQSKNEQVYFVNECWFQVKANATLEMGDLYEDWGIGGCYWSIYTTANHNYADSSTSTWLMYDSTLHNRGTERVCRQQHFDLAYVR
jgi:hypothetical protein